jgi:hypothetical protein
MVYGLYSRNKGEAYRIYKSPVPSHGRPFTANSPTISFVCLSYRKMAGSGV